MIEVGSREWMRATLALSLGSFLVFLNLYQTHPLLPLLANVFSVGRLDTGWLHCGACHLPADLRPPRGQVRPAPYHAVDPGRSYFALPAHQLGKPV